VSVVFILVLFVFVDGEVGFRQFDAQHIFVAGQMQRTGFGQGPDTLFKQVEDVFGMEGFELHGIFQSPAQGVFPVDVHQCGDFEEVMAGSEVPVLQSLYKEFRLRTEPQQAAERLLLSGVLLIRQEGPLMIFNEDILMALARPGMGGDEVVLVINQHLIGKLPQGDPPAGVFRRGRRTRWQTPFSGQAG